MYKEEIRSILTNRTDLRETLFSKGYLLTSDDSFSLHDYPFHGIWNKHKIQTIHGHNLFLYIHPKQKTEFYEDSDYLYIIIGHAINPYDKVIKEIELLKNLSSYNKSVDHNFVEYLNEMTGIFVLIVLNKENKTFKVYQDASGMKAVFYSIFDKQCYVSSHAQLIADLLNLKIDSNIFKLINKKFYSFSNRYLPGNLSPYKEVKRIGGNTYLCFENNEFVISRFYPTKRLNMAKNRDEVDILVNKISQLLTTTMEQIKNKWNNPAISLTGGTDSKTTLAVANHLYNSYFVFSYISKKQEEVDALAAKSICDKLNIEHHTYKISETNDKVEDFEIFKKIIDHNTSYFKKTSDNEIRKLIHFHKTKDFDIEVKSWASETVRVFLDRKYGMSMPKVLNERHFSILQSRYIFSPKLLKYADIKNYEFLKEIKLLTPLYNYEHADLYYWEFRMGAWGSSVVNSFDLCHEVIMPMNNRNIIELFLRIPRNYRIDDSIHKQIIEINNSQMKETDHIANLYFHNYRKNMEKLFFKLKTVFYWRRNR